MIEIKKLAKKILEIKEPLVSKTLSAAGYNLSDKKQVELAGIYEIDVVNALEQLPTSAYAEIASEVDLYKAFTLCYARYGYRNVLAKDKADAIERSKAEIDKIAWAENATCIKVISGEFLHEFRIKGNDGSIRVVHVSGKRNPLNKAEVSNLLKKMGVISEDAIYEVKYSFISSSYITFEKTIILNQKGGVSS